MCQNSTPKGIGFICRNTEGNKKKDKYVNSIRQIERVTGITFFPNLAEEIAVLVKDHADISEW
jgi:endonuclease G